ncbi:hypothetical protein MASR2M48_32620 [Spirochaetota bacterium]
MPATVTDSDREAAEYLSNISDLDMDEFGRDIMSSASLVSRKPVDEIVRLDMKEYSAAGLSFTVSQVEVHSPAEILERSAEVVSELKTMREQGGHYFSALMVTDITELSSVLFVEGDKDFIAMLRFPRLDDRAFELKDVLSRKKQLVPLLIELTEKALGA